MTSKGPFPRHLPNSTSDPEAISRNDWEAFAELEHLRDHWSVKHWAPGRTGYYWYLTFDDPDLVEFAAECQNGLGLTGIDAVPSDGLHITVRSVGDTTAVTSEQVDTLVSLARERLSEVKPFDLTIGPLSGSRSAIRFSVAPWDPLLDLQRILSACSDELSPERTTRDAPDPSSRFRPHLGIAYNNTDRAAAEVIAAVAALRRPERVSVRVDTVELVVLRRDGRCYRWDTRAAIPLGG
ncbi:2'-5' RNA ligase family protein [Nocardia sp. NPDC087230]|uniref:2'-5' RNA ligase family protein n=1 Tax=Nocardia sp. NPDC087230 TaxID=3364331 RepID=UPI003803BA94